MQVYSFVSNAVHMRNQSIMDDYHRFLVVLGKHVKVKTIGVKYSIKEDRNTAELRFIKNSIRLI